MLSLFPGRPLPRTRSYRRALATLLVATVAMSFPARDLAAQAKSAKWSPLIDGKTVVGWHNYDTPGKPVTGWTMENGVLIRTGDGGDLTTDKQYGNFELALEWKVEKGGNSGVIYRIDHAGEKSYLSGPEMQILDDAVHRDGKNPLTSAGANYALHPAPRGVVKAAGEWNSARLVVNGTHVEHWLNNTKMAEYELGSAHWETRRKASKFATAEKYGRATRGHIALQDHGDRVYFRNVRIRELP
ncbi:3-keto-disaccharide hydrolase [Gemmatimonas sp.]|uniref:3-keto-disaccharide hydrolase n=1 Tax=Gemmatimonas sp. TaxID=1962908 RepID=UPI003F6EB076